MRMLTGDILLISKWKKNSKKCQWIFNLFTAIIIPIVILAIISELVFNLLSYTAVHQWNVAGKSTKNDCMSVVFPGSVSSCSVYPCCVCLLRFCVFFWRCFVVTGFTKVFQSPSQSACVCTSPSSSGVTSFWHDYCDSLPHPHPSSRRMFLGDVTEVVFCIPGSAVCLFCWWFVFHHTVLELKTLHISASRRMHIMYLLTQDLWRCCHAVSFLQSCLLFLADLAFLKY